MVNRWPARGARRPSPGRKPLIIRPALYQHVHLATAHHAFGVFVFVVQVEVIDVGLSGTQYFAGFGPDVRFDAAAADRPDE